MRIRLVAWLRPFTHLLPVAPVVLASALLGPAPALADEDEGRTINRVVAVVGRDIITAYQVEQRLKPFQHYVDEAPPERRATVRSEMQKDMVDKLVAEQLMAHAARRMQITVSVAEVEAAMERVAQQNGLSREAMAREVNKSGLSQATYRDELSRQILEYKVLHAVISPPLGQRGLGEDEMVAALTIERAQFLDAESKRVYIEVRE